MSTDVIPFEERVGALSVGDVRSQVNLIQHIMREVMKKDEHYGVIPGTGTKPTLLKAGAEKLCLTFRLSPDYEIEQKQEGQHLSIVSKCSLTHIPSGQKFGAGMGSCSTRESKYAYRRSSRVCPACGIEAIIKGKQEFGGGWVCFKKKGGCGAKYSENDTDITSQVEGRVPNEDIADQYNTVLKMANKRSLVAAVLNTTAASDIFTQDIEDAVVRTEDVPPAEVSIAKAKAYARNPVGDIAADPLEMAFDKQRAEDAMALDACLGLDTLQEEFGERWAAAKGDAARRGALKAVYEYRKAKLTPPVDDFVAGMEREEAKQAATGARK